MRKTTAKILRKVVNKTGETAISKRIYRRLKKTYSRLSKQEKTLYMIGAKSFLAN